MKPLPLRVALTSLGCKVNYAEMAELAGRLAAAGCDVVPDNDPADVRVLNSCTVTTAADATTRQRLHKLRRQDPSTHLILTGCSVDGNPDRYADATTRIPLVTRVGSPSAAPAGTTGIELPDGVDAVFNNAHKSEIADYILQLQETHAGSHNAGDSHDPRLRSRFFLKVQDGCNHRCTYCIVWRARGASISIPSETVLERARRAVAEGYAELIICGVDLGSYGRDLGTRLSDLVKLLLDELGDSVRLRLSSVNANDISSALIDLADHRALCPHWHIPLQSGSDNVLRAMHRGYRRAQYLRVVQALRTRNPLTEITTDVMVAFPSETESDHQQTISLIHEVQFLGCHVFRYSPRPHTPAANLQSAVDDREARRRSAQARQAATAMETLRYATASTRVHDVVWDRVSSGTARGVSSTYHTVSVAADHRTLPGHRHFVLGERVNSGAVHGTLVAP